jgi:hypothetical protein
MLRPTLNILFAAALLLAPIGAFGSSIYVGNLFNTSDPFLNPDGDPPFVILGEFGALGPLDALSSTISFPSAGQVQDVTFYNANSVRFPSSYDFTLYALSWISSGSNEQTFSVDASASFSGDSGFGVHTLPVTGFLVKAGDLLAFAGIGPDYPGSLCCTGLPGIGPDATYESVSGSYTATPPSSAIGTLVTVGVEGDTLAGYQDFDNRFYDIGVDLNTAPEPGTFAIMVAGFGILAGIRYKKLNKV